MRKTITILLLVYLVALGGQSDYESWKQQQSQQIESYISEQDAAFVSFLEKDWIGFQAAIGKKRFEEPKPETPPVVESSPEPEFIDTSKVRSIPLPELKQEVKPVALVPVEDPSGNVSMRSFTDAGDVPEPEDDILTIDFYDVTTKIRYGEDQDAAPLASIDKDAIADFWQQTASADTDKTLTDLMSLKESLKMNDWAYIIYLKSLANLRYPESTGSANLIMWYYLVKSGYNIKVGYDKSGVFLLISGKQVIYGYPYVDVDGVTYYAVTFSDHSPEEIYTYQGEYPDAVNPIDLTLDCAPEFSDEMRNRTLKFTYQSKEYEIPVEYSLSAVTFYKDYPATDLDVYFETPLSVESEVTLTEKLKPLLEGRSEAEALNILLRFVQTAFEYKTDQDQFGGEKSFFPDEAIHYPYCDCEDRSILFARLVRNLLGRKVIGLKYPGHIATAVRLEADIEGDAVVYQDTKYLICDPTYINANIGTAMPDYREINPEVIPLH